MKTTQVQILRQKEKLEKLRLKAKYEGLGYKVSFPRISRDGGPIPDVYAINKITGDEIIFEIKSRTSLSRIKKSMILQMRNHYLKSYKKARFILVLPDEVEEKKPIESILNDLLLNYLDKNYNEVFSKNIEGFMKLKKIEELIMNYVNFNDFQNLTVRGEANLRFMISGRENEFYYENLADGIPFQFNLTLNYIFPKKVDQNIYKISDDSEILFDLSEFS